MVVKTDVIYTLYSGILQQKMSYNQFQIRFIRKSNVDDVLSIVPNEDSARTFILKYTDHESRLRNAQESTEQEVLDFVENIMALLPVDEEPFEFVQLLAPGFPSVLLAPERLWQNEVRSAFMNVVKSTLRNFPDRILYSTSRSKHVKFSDANTMTWNTNPLRSAAPLS